MKILFLVFYYLPTSQVPEYPEKIIGPFKTYGAADNFGKSLKGEGSYTVETTVKP